MRTKIEDKILSLLFKEDIIPREMSEILLPDIIFTPEFEKDFSAKEAYNLARSNLASSIQRMMYK